MSIKIQLCYICTKQTKFYKLNAFCSWITLFTRFLYPVNQFYFWTQISSLNFIHSLLLYQSFWQLWQVSNGKMLYIQDDAKTFAFLYKFHIPTFSSIYCLSESHTFHNIEQCKTRKCLLFYMMIMVMVPQIRNQNMIRIPPAVVTKMVSWVLIQLCIV